MRCANKLCRVRSLRDVRQYFQNTTAGTLAPEMVSQALRMLFNDHANIALSPLLTKVWVLVGYRGGLFARIVRPQRTPQFGDAQ